MGDRNHLHVCRHCGNVVATGSPTGPQKCFNCGGTDFSQFISIPQAPQVEEA
jgi:predicted  nucleic acid-binding Zn-ribbon protein